MNKTRIKNARKANARKKTRLKTFPLINLQVQKLCKSLNSGGRGVGSSVTHRTGRLRTR